MALLASSCFVCKRNYTVIDSMIVVFSPQVFLQCSGRASVLVAVVVNIRYYTVLFLSSYACHDRIVYCRDLLLHSYVAELFFTHSASL